VPSAWVFVSGMLAEARVSPSFLKTPLIFRDRVPSFSRLVASSFETRVSAFQGPRAFVLIEVRVPPVLIEA